MPIYNIGSCARLQPYKRENKRTRARDATRVAAPYSLIDQPPVPSSSVDDDTDSFTISEPVLDSLSDDWMSDESMDDFSFAEAASSDTSPITGSASVEPSAHQTVESSAGGGDDTLPAVGRLPEPGDVVEYPLSDVVKEQLQEERTAGLALLVGRNIDRGDKSANQGLPLYRMLPV